MNIHKSILVFLFTYNIALHAQVNPPSLRCISVLPNGTVQLTWVIPPDPLNQFVSYDVFSSTTGSAFTLAASVTPYATSTYTDVSANALNGSVYYYVQTKYNNGSPQTSSPSDTLRSIFLTVLSNATTDIASLNWNPIHVPNLPTSLGWYHIYKRYSLGPWMLIDSTLYGKEDYTDSAKTCADSIYYRIETADVSGCVSVSNEKGNYFKDNTAPIVPVIDSVSVDTATGDVIIGWEPSPSGDVQGYIINYHILNPFGWVYDTVYGINNTFFIDTNANANVQTEEFGVAAFDSCWSGTPSSPNTSPIGTTHKTVFLQATVDSCTREISLSWTSYQGWSSVGGYEIYVSENNSAYTLLATNSSSQTNYVHSGLNANSRYCYVIRANETGGLKTSSSNKICLNMIVPIQPLEHYLNYVTVTNPNSVEISCFVDVNAQVSKYIVKRATALSATFENIGEVVPTGSNIIKYTDATAQTSTASYFYKVVVMDICNVETVSSNIGRTIYLTALPDDANLVNKLSWNAYSDWDVKGSGVQEYHIFKGSDESGAGFTQINSVPSAQTIFNDDASKEISSSTGKFCYYAEAKEAAGNTLGFRETSKSNIACDVQNPLVWIPNVFTPNGDEMNDVFKPVTSFVNPQSYSFSVFDRWGTPVFQTTDISQGWDGKVKGNLAQDGMYVYLLIYSDEDGKTVKKRGAVTMLKSAGD